MMANIVEIRIPDIGDFAEVLVIELLVKRGEEVTLEQSLLTLESDKATLEVPSPFAGRIETLTVAVGDRVSKGSLIGTIATAAAEAPPHPRPPRRRLPSPLPGRDAPEFDLVVIGGGPAGTRRRSAQPILG